MNPKIKHFLLGLGYATALSMVGYILTSLSAPGQTLVPYAYAGLVILVLKTIEGILAKDEQAEQAEENAPAAPAAPTAPVVTVVPIVTPAPVAKAPEPADPAKPPSVPVPPSN